MPKPRVTRSRQPSAARRANLAALAGRGGDQRGVSSIAMIGVDARLLGRQQLLELALDLGGGPQVAAHHFSLSVDQEHGRQRDDAVVDRQAAVHAAGLEDLRPGELIFLEEGVELGTLVVDVDADDLQPATVIFVVDA